MFTVDDEKTLVDKMFAEQGWERFAPPLEELNAVDGYNIPVTEKYCRAAFDVIPNDIKMQALNWGLGDSDVRDRSYTFLLKYLKDNDLKIGKILP